MSEQPNEVDLSVYRGGPSPSLIKSIHYHTYVRYADGARFYRHIASPWIPLQTAEDFAKLNAIIDCYRERV